MKLRGLSIIGFQNGAVGGSVFHGIDPVSGETLPTDFHSADEKEVDRAALIAAAAFESLARRSGRDRAGFLRQIATNIELVAESIKRRGVAETGLPEGRLTAETGRTTAQLRLFADLLDEGSWIDARIDTALPNRKPLPKPDIRYMLQPVGPVAVFCASNFPLAFSVAGGDTASAFAAGCPVIVKAHHAHPGTAEIVGRAIADAVNTCELPEGTFSLIYGSGRVVGQALVKNPMVKAVGFTGSRSGGRALFDLAATRPEPIPVYAEMSSINPVFLFPGALKERSEAIATGLHGSLNLGVGQFCTNPGLILAAKDAETDAFKIALAEKISVTGSATMLHRGIRNSYTEGVSKKQANAKVTAVAVQECDAGSGPTDVTPAVFSTDAKTYLNDPSLNEEVFGPSTLIVESAERDDMIRIANDLEGHLTASIFGTEAELRANADLISVLQRKVGRLIFNQFPTGVEVCHSMVHGGPYPATTDGRSTSVGSAAIFRFSRPISYQNFPQDALPDELKDANPLGIMRDVDGELTRSSI
jgi:alpha-ketoglutaric semialdehyde dehydrogenase